MIWFTALLFLSVLPPDSPAGSPGDPPVTMASPGELYRDAYGLYRARRAPEARAALNDLLAHEATRDQRCRALELLACCYLAERNTMDARATLGQLGDTDPDYRIAARTAPPGLLRLYFEANPDLIRQSTPNTLAVLDLRNHSMTEHASMEPVGQGLAEVLIARLSGDSALTVVERERLDYVLQEIALPDSLLDNATAVRAGRLLGAQNLLLGGFTRIKDRLRIDARLVRTETGEVLRTGSVEGKLDDVFALVEDLAEKMIPELAAAMGERSQADTEFLGFYEYALGLEALDTEDLSGAREHFERALAHAPDLKMAAERLDQLAPILASGGHE